MTGLLIVEALLSDDIGAAWFLNNGGDITICLACFKIKAYLPIDLDLDLDHECDLDRVKNLRSFIPF